MYMNVFQVRPFFVAISFFKQVSLKILRAIRVHVLGNNSEISKLNSNELKAEFSAYGNSCKKRIWILWRTKVKSTSLKMFWSKYSLILCIPSVYRCNIQHVWNSWNDWTDMFLFSNDLNLFASEFMIPLLAYRYILGIAMQVKLSVLYVDFIIFFFIKNYRHTVRPLVDCLTTTLYLNILTR